MKEFGDLKNRALLRRRELFEYIQKLVFEVNQQNNLRQNDFKLTQLLLRHLRRNYVCR